MIDAISRWRNAHNVGLRRRLSRKDRLLSPGINMSQDRLGWKVFLTWMEGRECSIYINMNAKVDESLPYLVVVAHRLLTATDRGFRKTRSTRLWR